MDKNILESLAKVEAVEGLTDRELCETGVGSTSQEQRAEGRSNVSSECR